MITFSVLSDSAVKLTFDGNSHYLQDGEITVPKNSLALVKDESELITFIKAATGDAYLSFHIEDTNFANYTELENWYKTNMVSAYGGGGGGGGVTSGEVQTMIDNSISGKANTSDVTSAVTELNAALSGETTRAMASEEALSGAVSAVTDALEDKVDVSELEEVELAVAQSINVLAQSVSGKQDTLVAGSGITISGNVISADGGSSITVDPTLDSGSTNPVANSAITAALDLKCNIGTGADSPMRWINRNNYYCDATKVEGSSFILAGWISVNGQSVITDGANEWQYGTHINLDLVEKAEYDEAQLATSNALNNLNTRVNENTTALGGITLLQISQTDYDALTDKDPNTLYIIITNNNA